MGNGTCRTPGHRGKPEHGKTGLCQACYRRNRREELRDGQPKRKPGPKPDPSKPFSRHNDETSHHNRRVKCKYGHFFDGVDVNGKQTCSTCSEARRNAPCPYGHPATFKNQHGGCKECGRLRQPAVNRMQKFGLTPERTEAMLEEQDYECLLCHKKFDLEAKRPFCVDHDHACCPGEKTCGKCLRGLLCDDCNRSLHDEIEWHIKAIQYLQNWNQIKEERYAV